MFGYHGWISPWYGSLQKRFHGIYRFTQRPHHTTTICSPHGWVLWCRFYGRPFFCCPVHCRLFGLAAKWHDHLNQPPAAETDVNLYPQSEDWASAFHKHGIRLRLPATLSRQIHHMLSEKGCRYLHIDMCPVAPGGTRHMDMLRDEGRPLGHTLQIKDALRRYM
jgi:hypothetical protein